MGCGHAPIDVCEGRKHVLAVIERTICLAENIHGLSFFDVFFWGEVSSLRYNNLTRAWAKQ